MAQAVGMEIALPTKEERRARSSFSRSKPMAQVAVKLDNGGVCDIVVPVRAARLLRDEGLSFPLDVDDAFDAIHALEGRVCLTMLVELLGRRDHSAAEAREKLAAYGFRDEELDATIARGIERRYLDDARFMSYFIEERKRRGWGRRKIEVELKRKGTDPAELPGYPDAFFTSEDDGARATALLEHKRIPENRAFEKLVRFLMTKGFSYEVASAAVRERLADTAS